MTMYLMITYFIIILRCTLVSDNYREITSQKLRVIVVISQQEYSKLTNSSFESMLSNAKLILNEFDYNVR